MFLEMLYTEELSVPAFQIMLLVALSTVVLLFGRVRLALLIHYLFTLYWGYTFSRDTFFSESAGEPEAFTFFYFGFGLVIVIFAIIAFLRRPD